MTEFAAKSAIVGGPGSPADRTVARPRARRSRAGAPRRAARTGAAGPVIRRATPADAAALHALVADHVAEGHLLPRELTEIRRHAERFVVCEDGGRILACAELAPLSTSVAEVRSLVVGRPLRRSGIASRMIDELRDRARLAGFETLCAFTHDARFFVGQGFSIVPHPWVPEKIATDCVACPVFRRCGQRAMILPLHARSRAQAAVTAPQPIAV